MAKTFWRCWNVAAKNDNKKMDKNDHSGMKKAAQVVKGVVVLGGLVLSVIPGLKGLANLTKKS